MNNKNILISGAGIAGLTLAYWLKRFGFNPTLIEKHPNLRISGYKIDIRGVALEIVKRMGIYSSIVENQTTIAQTIFIDKKGLKITEMSADLCGIRLENIDLEIMRGNLCCIIKEAVGEIECIYGDSITNISENPDGVNVEFEKNATRNFDLVIGADGLHSAVRKLVFKNEQSFSREFGIYVSIFSIPNFLNLTATEIEFHSLRKFVNIYKDRNDTQAKVTIAFTAKTSVHPKDHLEQKKLIEETFKDSFWEMPRILKEMNESSDFYFDSMKQIHMPSWSNGRVTLVGDAAYSPTPMSGQGTSIAIAGAYLLAKELADSQGDYKHAFSRYEELMRPFVKKNQALADMGIRMMKTSFYSTFLYGLGSILPAKLLHYFKKSALKQTTEAANALVLDVDHSFE